MTARAPTIPWPEANQRYLSAAVSTVRARLECALGLPSAGTGNKKPRTERSATSAMNAARRALPSPSALDILCQTLGLSTFERSILLLTAGMELDSGFAPLCAAAQNDPARAYPTFSLALSVFPDAHWSALAPSAPLRRWKLLNIEFAGTLTTSPLRIDERTLCFLTGIAGPDERLSALVEPLATPDSLPPSHAALSRRLALGLAADPQARTAAQVCGSDAATRHDIIAAACADLGLSAWLMPAHRLPNAPAELHLVQRLWEREAVLEGFILALECEPLDAHSPANSPVQHLIDALRTPVIISTREPRPAGSRPLRTLEVPPLPASEQRALWEQHLGPAGAGLNGALDRILSHFTLSAPAIRAAAASGIVTSPVQRRQRNATAATNEDPARFERALWDACRTHSRPRLDDLAQRIESSATWDDIILADRPMQALREIASQLRHRATVYETWGMGRTIRRGLGISALFSGASGTGKTLAAEVLAAELRLDLYRIDLSQVVSKYIGETERNLARVFEAAEEGGAVLLFDEADALFGKRSEVRDSHDRYANIEVSYLLQRMEAYRGLAILTTNMKEALDPAFLRRIRFVVHFPFPDASQRARIWQRMFPSQLPTEGLDHARLARLDVAGGNIRNMALSAAFIAADAGEPLRMRHLLHAARTEFAKLERHLTEASLGECK